MIHLDMKKIVALRIVGSLFLLLSLAFGIYLSQQVIKYFSKAGGESANVVVDMSTQYGKVPDPWRNLAQGGEEKGRMLVPVIEQVKPFRPEYIRIDHVFDFYTQDELDAVISDITSTGAKPFISLSYMPPAISKSGDINDLPRDWGEWELLVQRTVEHISGKNGLAISGVYYEVWNEPDLFGKFTIGGEKNYLDLYLHTAIGASRASNTLPFKLGGPGTTDYFDRWMSALSSFANKNNLKLDFLSWHRYSKNLDDFESDIGHARPYERELVFSEMGPNSENDTVYDGYFGAIHQIAVSAVLYHASIGKAFAFEIKDGPGPEKYWGRWGMFTHEKYGTPEIKPRGQAIKFLNNMTGGNVLSVTGEGGWVKAIAKRITEAQARILLVNYDPRGKHEEFVPIKFTNLQSNNFSLKRTEFLGSSFTQDIATTSAEWATYQYLKPNSAMILEVNYK